jgi:hypothetical protein
VRKSAEHGEEIASSGQQAAVVAAAAAAATAAVAAAAVATTKNLKPMLAAAVSTEETHFRGKSDQLASSDDESNYGEQEIEKILKTDESESTEGKFGADMENQPYHVEWTLQLLPPLPLPPEAAVALARNGRLIRAQMACSRTQIRSSANGHSRVRAASSGRTWRQQRFAPLAVVRATAAAMAAVCQAVIKPCQLEQNGCRTGAVSHTLMSLIAIASVLWLRMSLLAPLRDWVQRPDVLGRDRCRVVQHAAGANAHLADKSQHIYRVLVLSTKLYWSR